MHSVETQTEDLATHGLTELFEIVQDENIIDTGLITYADDHYEEEMSDDVGSFIDEMLDGDRRQEVRPYDAMFDYDGLEETNIDGKVIIGKCETIYAVGDRKPQPYGKTGTDWQKIRITLDSGSTGDVMPSDELCQVEAVPCTGSRANRTMFAANGTKIESKGEKQFKAITGKGFPLNFNLISGAVKKILKRQSHVTKAETEASG